MWNRVHFIGHFAARMRCEYGFIRLCNTYLGTRPPRYLFNTHAYTRQRFMNIWPECIDAYEDMLMV